MRRILLSLVAAAAVVSAASLVSTRADAMTAGSASGIRTAVDAVGSVEQTAWVCGRYRCWWRPNYYAYSYSYRPYRYRTWRRW